MSADKKWRLICYDVRDPKRYRALYKVMKGVGRRIQYSVFRSRLDDRAMEQLRWRLARILDPTDRLLVVDLCPSCASRAISRNNVPGWTDAPAAFTIVACQGSAPVEPSTGRDAENGSDSRKMSGAEGMEGS
jgi:CRISPR-associated protein Cas2